MVRDETEVDETEVDETDDVSAEQSENTPDETETFEVSL